MANYSVPIAIEKKDDFLRSPPAGWQLDNTTGRMRCEDGSVSVLVSDKKFEGGSNVIPIGNLADLETTKKMIFSKPLFTTVLCGKSYARGRAYNSREASAEDSEALVHNEEYIALVQTRHQQIEQMFNQAFNRVTQLLNEGKTFRVTVSLSESVKVWFMENVHMPNESNSTTFATQADIHFVNGVTEPGFADRCFSCEAFTMKCFWCVCFPFFFLCFLPFLIYKKCILGLTEEKIKQPVPVTFHGGPFQMGFNLLNLLYPPGSTITTVTTYPQPVQQQPQQQYYQQQQQPQYYQQQQQPQYYQQQQQQQTQYYQPQQPNYPPNQL